MKPTKSFIPTLVLFLLAAGMIMTKCWLFAETCLSDLKVCDYSILVRILAVASSGICIGSVVWLTKRPWIEVLLMLVVDTWIVANMVYYKANHLLLTYSAIAMSSNLHGFEAAVFSYLDWRMLLVVGLTIAYIVTVLLLKPDKRYVLGFVISLLVAFVFSVVATFVRPYHRGLADPNREITPISQMDPREAIRMFNPFVIPPSLMTEQWLIQMNEANYTMHHSVVAYGVYVFTEGRKAYLERTFHQQQVQLSEPEKTALLQVLERGTAPCDTLLTCSENLMIVLVESWESWTLDSKDLHGNWVLPKIHLLMERYPHLYVSKVKDQIRHGVSSDGQMMINTGLLPLIDGSAAISYGENIYPNLAHFYEHSALFDMCEGAWNANVVSKQWGYKEHVAPNRANTVWMEDKLMSMASDYLTDNPVSSCIQVITYMTHSPFTMYKWYPDGEVYAHVDLPDEISEQNKDYLRSAHWMDHFVGGTLLQMAEDGKLDNTTLVLVGDHTYHRADGYYTPLLVFSPQMEQNCIINDEVYQIDTYSTLLSLIERKDYFWQGFGADLTQTEFVRPLDFNVAESVSDKIIRMNYFANPVMVQPDRCTQNGCVDQ